LGPSFNQLQSQIFQNLFDDLGVLNGGDDSHLALAFGRVKEPYFVLERVCGQKGDMAEGFRAC
jgi:hypothetical protein